MIQDLNTTCYLKAMEKLSQFVVRSGRLIIILVLLVSAFLGYQIQNLEINSDVIDSLPDSDPDAILLKEIGEKFGGNRLGIVILETDDIYTTEILGHILQITDSLDQMDDIQSVTSITNIIEIRGGEFGLEVGTLVDEYDLPSSKDDLRRLRQRVNSKDLYKGSLVSEDGTACSIIFALDEDADIHKVSNAVKSMIGSLDLPENVYYSGSPMLVSAISELISRDMSRLIPITFVVLGIVLFLGFRSWIGVVLPLFVAGLGILWTIGIMAWGGFQMSMVSSNIPILLLAIGSAYSIHVVNRIRIENDRADIKSAIRIALIYIFIPVLLSAITTAAGFASFTFGAYLEMIRDYGLFTALGTLISCILSLTLVPAVLSFFPPDTTALSSKLSESSFLTKSILTPLKNILYKRPRTLLTTWSVLILIGILGIFLIKREVDIKDYFKKNNPTRIAEEIMTEKFGGVKPVFVLFKGDMQSPEVLKAMMQTKVYMEQSPDILSAQSIADLIVDLNAALGQDSKIPDNRAVIEQLWFLIDGNRYLDRLVTPDLDEGVIISKFISPDNQSKIAFTNYMRDYIDENPGDEYEISITGMPFVDITMDRSLIKSQLSSLSIALVFVVIILGLILKSLKSGLQAAIPIMATIIILFGMMGFLGIPLNIGTVLVASVALGIGIDYSIHIISHFNDSLGNGSTVDQALEEAILISGKAIVINVLSVTAGFLVLLFSQMVPLQYFGLLVAISMIGSGLGALTLLPVILVLSPDKRRLQIK
jgi:predicted RND superfamily exporter protein